MNSKRPPILIALFFANVGALIATPVMMMSFSNPPSWRQIARSLVYSLVFANCLGASGGLLLPRAVRAAAGRSYPIPAVILLGSVVIAAIGCFAGQSVLLLLHLAIPATFGQDFFSILKMTSLLAAAFGLGSFFYESTKEQLRHVTARLHEKDLAAERARKLAVEARLASLEARLRPHFLFNVLNSVTALIPLDPSRAEETLVRLSHLLRKGLDSTQSSLVPLEQEIETTREYLAIESTRLGAKTVTHIEVPNSLAGASIPPFSIQALAENAVRHGVSDRRDAGEIRIAADRIDGALRIRVSDNGPGFDLSDLRAGHGLDTLVGRLDAIFGPAARLNVLREDGLCVVELVIPQHP